MGSNLILVQSLGFSCWSDVVLVHKAHLVEHTACEVLLQWLTWAKVGDIISLCQVSDSAHDRKVWILVVRNNWSKGELLEWDTLIIWQWEERNHLSTWGRNILGPWKCKEKGNN